MSKKLTTYRAIAEANGIHRNTISRLWRLEGAPQKNQDGVFDPKACTEFILAHSRRADVLGKLDPALQALRKWELFEKTRWLAMKNDRDAGLLILKTDVEAQFARCIGACQRVLDTIPSRLAPEIVGLPTLAAEQLMKHAFEEALACLRND